MRVHGCRLFSGRKISLLAPACAGLISLLAPALCIVALLGSTPPAAASLAVETHDVLEFEYQQTGATEEEAVRLACIRAVNATVGRILFSDFSLQARDRLDPYLQKHWQKFVASYYVLERRFDRTGFGCRIRVLTYPEILTRDLRSKKFLYLPRPNPYHYVYLSETLEGQPANSDLGRRTAMATLREEGANVTEQGSALPPDNTYIMESAAAFNAGRQAATRLGAEIILTGRAETTKVGEERIFYDLIHTYETVVHLDMIRVDDGTLLGSIDAMERASDTNADEARNESIRAAVADAVTDLTARTRAVWPRQVLDRGKFSLMFTDVTPEETEALMEYIRSQLSYGTRVWLKTWYGNVAVVNVDTPRAWSVLERALQDFKAFDLRIESRRGKRITVSVKH